MRITSRSDRVRILSALVEGNSIRATVRMTGAAKNTVAKLLVDIGEVCSEYQDTALKNLPCERIECDEIWTFCYAKQKNVPAELRGATGFGDVWTWTAICATTKLVPSWLVADRSALCAKAFMDDLASRCVQRLQLTTDGHRPYLTAVKGAFGEAGIDYAMLEKHYGRPASGEVEAHRRYSPTELVSTERKVIHGTPDPALISTSYVERQNLTMRMQMRRFTRLTNGFSKKIENLEAAVALHFMHYNFSRPHQTLRTPAADGQPATARTPAMAAGVADHMWSLDEIVALLEAKEATERAASPIKPGRKALAPSPGDIV